MITKRKFILSAIAGLLIPSASEAIQSKKLIILQSPLSGSNLDLNFINGSPIDSRINFTRASNATYFDVTGTLQTALSNIPRIDYDPITHIVKGLLIEESRTNLFLNNAALSTQSITTTATPYTLSFYGTGTVVLSGTFTGTLVGTGTFPTRVTSTFTPTAGTLTATVTGSVLNAQIEAGSFVTSVIPTTGTAATRNTDNPTMATTAFPFNPRAGTFLVDATQFGIGSFQGLFHIDDGSVSNRMEIYRVNASNNINFIGTTAGSNDTLAAIGVVTAGVPFKAGGTYSGSGKTSVFNGTLGPTSSVTVPGNLLTTLRLGQADSGTSFPTNGYIRRVRYWPRALNNNELQQITM